MLLKSIRNVDITAHDGFLLIEADPQKFEQGPALVNFKNTDRMDDEIYNSQRGEEQNNELTVQVETLKDLFGNINDNIMNVYEVTKKKIKKTIVKRIPESSIDQVTSMGKSSIRHIKDGINYI